MASQKPSENSSELGLLRTFSSTKRRILKLLKQNHELDLKTLSEKLQMTKMGALKHLNELEEGGYVERLKKSSTRGRPKHFFKLSPESTDIFPRAYSNLTCFALEFIEEQLGEKGVESALRKRQQNVFKEYSSKMKNKNLDERISTLAELRDKEGYMASINKLPGGDIELLEFNCPIFDVANKYWSACMVEKELFENLLEVDVQTTHRVVNNENVCRFVIKSQKK